MTASDAVQNESAASVSVMLSEPGRLEQKLQQIRERREQLEQDFDRKLHSTSTNNNNTTYTNSHNALEKAQQMIARIHDTGPTRLVDFSSRLHAPAPTATQDDKPGANLSASLLNKAKAAYVERLQQMWPSWQEDVDRQKSMISHSMYGTEAAQAEARRRLAQAAYEKDSFAQDTMAKKREGAIEMEEAERRAALERELFRRVKAEEDQQASLILSSTVSNDTKAGTEDAMAIMYHKSRQRLVALREELQLLSSVSPLTGPASGTVKDPAWSMLEVLEAKELTRLRGIESAHTQSLDDIRERARRQVEELDRRGELSVLMKKQHSNNFYGNSLGTMPYEKYAVLLEGDTQGLRAALEPRAQTQAHALARAHSDETERRAREGIERNRHVELRAERDFHYERMAERARWELWRRPATSEGGDRTRYHQQQRSYSYGGHMDATTRPVSAPGHDGGGSRPSHDMWRDDDYYDQTHYNYPPGPNISPPHPPPHPPPPPPFFDTHGGRYPAPVWGTPSAPVWYLPNNSRPWSSDMTYPHTTSHHFPRPEVDPRSTTPQAYYSNNSNTASPQSPYSDHPSSNTYPSPPQQNPRYQTDNGISYQQHPLYGTPSYNGNNSPPYSNSNNPHFYNSGPTANHNNNKDSNSPPYSNGHTPSPNNIPPPHLTNSSGHHPSYRTSSPLTDPSGTTTSPQHPYLNGYPPPPYNTSTQSQPQAHPSHLHSNQTSSSSSPTGPSNHHNSNNQTPPQAYPPSANSSSSPAGTNHHHNNNSTNQTPPQGHPQQFTQNISSPSPNNHNTTPSYPTTTHNTTTTNGFPPGSQSPAEPYMHTPHQSTANGYQASNSGNHNNHNNDLKTQQQQTHMMNNHINNINNNSNKNSPNSVAVAQPPSSQPPPPPPPPPPPGSPLHSARRGIPVGLTVGGRPSAADVTVTGHSKQVTFAPGTRTHPTVITDGPLFKGAPGRSSAAGGGGGGGSVDLVTPDWVSMSPDNLSAPSPTNQNSGTSPSNARVGESHLNGQGASQERAQQSASGVEDKTAVSRGDLETEREELQRRKERKAQEEGAQRQEQERIKREEEEQRRKREQAMAEEQRRKRELLEVEERENRRRREEEENRRKEEERRRREQEEVRRREQAAAAEKAEKAKREEEMQRNEAELQRQREEDARRLAEERKRMEEERKKMEEEMKRPQSKGQTSPRSSSDSEQMSFDGGDAKGKKKGALSKLFGGFKSKGKKDSKGGSSESVTPQQSRASSFNVPQDRPSTADSQKRPSTADSQKKSSVFGGSKASKESDSSEDDSGPIAPSVQPLRGGFNAFGPPPSTPPMAPMRAPATSPFGSGQPPPLGRGMGLGAAKILANIKELDDSDIEDDTSMGGPSFSVFGGTQTTRPVLQRSGSTTLKSKGQGPPSSQQQQPPQSDDFDF